MTIPDFPKDVSGHDAQEGVQEEPDEDLDPVAADVQDTGQPVTVVDLGEKRRGSKFPEKSDIPNLTIFGLYRAIQGSGCRPRRNSGEAGGLLQNNGDGV